MKLTHLGISHFRSIGETPVMIDLSKKITVLVGQNDCGKSNVFQGFSWLARLRTPQKLPDFQEADFHKRSRNNFPKVSLQAEPIETDNSALRALGSLCVVGQIVRNLEGSNESREIADLEVNRFIKLRDELNMGGYPMIEDKIKRLETAGQLGRSLLGQIPDITIIPQFRRIENTEDYSISGKGIIKLLSKWERPEFGEEPLGKRFQRVVELLQALLDRPNVRVQVPDSKKQIIVDDDGFRLPLESHGTGIHQLIVLAIAVLSQEDATFCIEEPEVHLHPVLQRRFLKFLREQTGSNRYIIATHSQTMIAPAEDVDVIHLKMVDGVTIPTRVTTGAHALEALDDLGVRASDLLQANAVIWVEGPSDRIYLKRWMELVNHELGEPELIEGIDYAMMFYGGRLLSHLSLEREGEIDDGFIQLLRINQRSAIVMDSDRKKRDDALNTTKQRVIAESEANRLHAWVTDGREIENYLTQHTVEAAAAEAGISLDDRFSLAATGKMDDSFKRMVGAKALSWCDYATNKVPWAHRFVKHIELQDISATLKDQVKALLHFIRPNA